MLSEGQLGLPEHARSQGGVGVDLGEDSGVETGTRSASGSWKALGTDLQEQVAYVGHFHRSDILLL